MQHRQSLDENNTQNKRRKISIIRTVILAISIIAFLFSAVMIIITLVPADEEDYSQYMSSTVESTVQETVTQEEVPANPIDFIALKSQNPDVVAWIKVQGTNIDYPVLQSGEDKAEDYYLDHDMNCKQKRAGSIYIQRFNSCDFSDNNTVIYGHNMRNGTRFAALKKFRNKDFFNQNRTVTVYTPGHILNYEIFSAFIYDDRHIISSFDFENKNSYAEYLEDCLNPKSSVKNVRTDRNITTENKIITLSTCTSADSERYLLVAVLLEDIETQ